MIDTDKYEGHTPAPWYRMHSNNTIRSEPMGDDAEAYLFDIVGATTVDAELAADAPLLLEEVKRLRVYEVAWKMLYHNAIEEGRETRTRTWKEIMELVRSDVKEMVDTEDAVFDEWAKQIIGGFE